MSARRVPSKITAADVVPHATIEVPIAAYVAVLHLLREHFQGEHGSYIGLGMPRLDLARLIVEALDFSDPCAQGRALEQLVPTVEPGKLYALARDIFQEWARAGARDPADEDAERGSLAAKLFVEPQEGETEADAYRRWRAQYSTCPPHEPGCPAYLTNPPIPLVGCPACEWLNGAPL